MTDLNDDAGRNFEAMSAREAQEALADELDGELTDEQAGDAIQMGEDNDAEAEKDAIEDAIAGDLEGGGEADEEPGDDEAHADDPVWTAAQTAEHLRMAEALLFAAVEPLDDEAISARLPEGADIKTILELIAQQYENRGVNLTRAAGKYRFVTAPDVAHVLEKEKIEPKKVSRAALETLAIIAYHQPCTRADIEDVRGVAVSPGSLDQLMEIGWIRMRGRRRSAPGRPLLYATTQAFLEHFNLEAVGDLPGMADLKAAGLLDARLPPGFSIPSPGEAGDDEDIDEDGGEAEFVQDFHEAETPDEGIDDAIVEQTE
ncbi:MAG: SMC-Scp complex subunit ScpB [Parvularculaceae bacterium]